MFCGGDSRVANGREYNAIVAQPHASRLHAASGDGPLFTPRDGASLRVVHRHRFHAPLGSHSVVRRLPPATLQRQRRHGDDGRQVLQSEGKQATPTEARTGRRDAMGLLEGGGDPGAHQLALRIRAEASGQLGHFLQRVPLAEGLYGLRDHARRHAALLHDADAEDRDRLESRVPQQPLPPNHVR